MQNAPGHSAILFTYIKRLLVLKIFFFVFFEWPFKTGFPVSVTLHQIWWQLSYQWFRCSISTALNSMFCLLILIQRISTTITSITVLMEFPSIINWTSPFPFSGMLGGIFHFSSNFDRNLCKQTVETQNAASDLGLHYLPTSHKKDARLIFIIGELMSL